MLDPKYPIGKYEPTSFSTVQKNKNILIIAQLPAQIESAVSGLSSSQLHTTYRENGWTVHQLVHHILDSHTQAHIRFKLALTEDNPTIKPYHEDAFVRLADVTEIPVQNVLPNLRFVHDRWLILMRSIPDEFWETKSIFHPEKKLQMNLHYLAGMYAWHSLHHTAHITELRKAKQW
ncbi:MAG: putative metal-dependent hydrolase [Sediminibacterium sp.]|nr:putative metal-dependent hydrolase [Sediminibacterium sp.]